MALDWKSVKAEHVAKACQIVSSGVAPRASAKGIFVLIDGKRLPAKQVLRLAYCLAQGIPLDSKVKFSSGAGTVNRLRALGCEVEHVKVVAVPQLEGRN
jgi:hypothetical protein